MFNDVYYLNIELNGYSWICLVILFCVYNFGLIQFAPEIKKFIKEKLYRKRQYNIGFK